MKATLTQLILFFVVFTTVSKAQINERDYPKTFTIQVSNPMEQDRENVLINISATQLLSIKNFNPQAFVVLDGAKEIASQFNYSDKNHNGLVFVLDKLKANEVKTIVVRYNPTGTLSRTYTKRTQAELAHKINGEWKNREYIGGTFKNVNYLRVPKEHKDHSWFIRYEGPGWESDKVGYRFYLDQRNATDVFGKTVTDPVLQLVGQDGFDSYHNMQPWGMDVMKVGKSLGIGSIGALTNGKVTRVEFTDSVTCSIAENGVVFSSIKTNYYGWKLGNQKHDLHSTISIHAGTRLSHQELEIKSKTDTLCTGIVKDTAAYVFSEAGDATHWGYIATYGKQSLNKDNLGLVVFFNPKHSLGFSADANSNLVLLKPVDGKIDYYFAAAWELEKEGITSKEAFLKYVQNVASQLALPINTTIRK